MSPPTFSEAEIFAIERPHSNLLIYYAIRSLAALPVFPFVFAPLFFKYHTLRYRFDPEGISMRWGLLFRREINLTYARIQDIHLSCGILERWLGLATVSIQTASGTAGAEMTIQGLKEFEELRDFLYSRMRGRQLPTSPAAIAGAPSAPAVPSPPGEALELLRQIHADLVAVRQALTASGESPGPKGPD